MIFNLIYFSIFCFFLPYFLFGIALGWVASMIVSLFQPTILMGAIWFGIIGASLLPFSTPSNEDFSSLVESVAQGHLLGMTTPTFMFVLAGVTAAIAMAVRLRKAF